MVHLCISWETFQDAVIIVCALVLLFRDCCVRFDQYWPRGLKFAGEYEGKLLR